MCNDSRSAVTIAQSPFDDTNGDVILHTSDHVDFRIFRLILTLSSPFFQGMFALPQPSDSPPAHPNTISPSNQNLSVHKHIPDNPRPISNSTPISPPSIDIAEDSHTLDTLLRFLYPNTHAPPFRNLTHARNVALAASKYDMPIALDKIADKVQTQYAVSHPLHVYFIACRMGWERVARVAARHTLDTTLFPGDHDTVLDGDGGCHSMLHYPDAGVAYHRLEMYRAACRRALEPRLDDMDLFLDDDASCESDDEGGVGGGISGRCLNRWTALYMGNIKLAVIKSPTKEALDHASVVPEEECARCCIQRANAIAMARLRVASEIENALSQVELRFS